WVGGGGWIGELAVSLVCVPSGSSSVAIRSQPWSLSRRDVWLAPSNIYRARASARSRQARMRFLYLASGRRKPITARQTAEPRESKARQGSGTRVLAAMVLNITPKTPSRKYAQINPTQNFRQIESRMSTSARRRAFASGGRSGMSSPCASRAPLTGHTVHIEKE